MASDRTPKLGLNVFAETDIVDFGEINENSVKIDNAFAWKRLNDTYYTGKQASAIALPEEYTELSIKVNMQNDQGTNIIDKICVIRDELYDNNRTQKFRAGYFYNINAGAGTANGGVVSFLICKETINLDHAYLNQENVTNDTSWSVYYR